MEDPQVDWVLMSRGTYRALDIEVRFMDRRCRVIEARDVQALAPWADIANDVPKYVEQFRIWDGWKFRWVDEKHCQLV